jgi:hypothetical protein
MFFVLDGSAFFLAVVGPGSVGSGKPLDKRQLGEA